MGSLGQLGGKTVPTIAAVAAPFERDVDACLERIGRWLRVARARRADLVAFPESALGGYVLEPRPGEVRLPEPPPALSLAGPEIERVIDMAGPTVVCLGLTEEAPGGPYSTGVCLSGDGVLGVQRKVHIPPSEGSYYSAGERFEAFDTPVGRLGLVLCYDKLFPEAARTLALDGAEIVVAPAAWPVCRSGPARLMARDRQTRYFNLVDRARAVENQVVWVATNQTGNWGALRFPGNAKIVGPRGDVLARTRAREGVAMATVDPREALADARGRICHLDHRRPQSYGSVLRSLPV